MERRSESCASSAPPFERSVKIPSDGALSGLLAPTVSTVSGKRLATEQRLHRSVIAKRKVFRLRVDPRADDVQF